MPEPLSSNGMAKPAGRETAQPPEEGWLLLIYHVPPEPSNNRVTIWRNLKRMGGLYLQQCVCIVPAFPACLADVQAAIEKITAYGGSYNKFHVRDLEPREEAQLLAGFRELSRKEYEEILEECRTKFVKEIEFERFRQNYTYEEAEEIREDLHKIRRWYERVVERDWFDAGMREQVEGELQLCEELLQAFEADVYERISQDQGVGRAADQTGAAAQSLAAIEGGGGGDPRDDGDDGDEESHPQPARARALDGGNGHTSSAARKRKAASGR